MPQIIKGLTRGINLDVFNGGVAFHEGMQMSYYAATDSLGVVLPSNSPAVNSLWLPALAMKIPVVLKPGREEPWTPWRLIQALIAAGCPSEAFGFYGAQHDGGAAIMRLCDRCIIFGDQKIADRYKHDPTKSVHGPGYSKVLIGDDMVDRWPEFIDCLASSVAANGGRSCVNASMIMTPRHGREIADALSEALAAYHPRSADDPEANISAFANPRMADYIDSAIDSGLETEGAEEFTAHRDGSRKVVFEGSTFMQPTVIHCDSMEHPLANREFMCPFVTIVELPQDEMLDNIGHSLVVSGITESAEFADSLLQSPLIERLNIGVMPTNTVKWDQPHEGNLFEFLYHRRAINSALVPPPASAKQTIPLAVADSTLESFEFQHGPTRIVYGSGSLNRLGELVRSRGGTRVLLVTDPGIVAAGHAERAVRGMESSGLSVVVFDKVHENPTTDDVDACLAVATGGDGIDFIVGLGGGSSMDTAKGCNFILTNGGRMHDYWGVGKATQAMLPLIAVPTTAGTGSECQSFALIGDSETHHKMACGDDKAAACVSILDPDLTASQPRFVAACTGMDAIVHAVETAVTNRRSPMSLLYAREAFRLTNSAFPIVLEGGKSIAAAVNSARGDMLLGAAVAGMAIQNSMLGAAHSAANPLTANFDVVHGQAVGIMLPPVIRFNAQDPVAAENYRLLAVHAGLCPATADVDTGVAALLDSLESALQASGLGSPLSSFGVTEDAIGKLAAEAAGQWTANFNPRPITEANFAALYREALE
jgi:alcohol dehydrogenase class IV